MIYYTLHDTYTNELIAGSFTSKRSAYAFATRQGFARDSVYVR